jgi:hypothetical protein
VAFEPKGDSMNKHIFISIFLLFNTMAFSQPNNEVINNPLFAIASFGTGQLDITVKDFLESLTNAKNTIQWEQGDNASEWILRTSREDKLTKKVNHTAWAFRILSDTKTGSSNALLYRILVDGKEFNRNEVWTFAQRFAPEARAKREREREIAEKESKMAEEEKLKLEKEKQINTAFFISGTADELEKAGVIEKEGGEEIFGSLVGFSWEPTYAYKDYPSFDGSRGYKVFTRIDIRKNDLISLPKSFKIVSNHREELLKKEKEQNDSLYFKIENPSKFWNLSKFLIVIEK